MTISTGARIRLRNHLSELNIKQNEGWRNFTGSVENPGTLVIDVDSAEQVESVIQFIKAENEKPENQININQAGGWSDDDYLQCEPSCCFGYGRFFSSWVPGQRAQKYNEDYNADQGVKEADVVLRFSKKYTHRGVAIITNSQNDSVVDPHQDTIEALQKSRAIVNSGVQLKQLHEALRIKKLALTTSPPNIFHSAVEAALRGETGTGKDQPAFNGLIKAITYVDNNGERQTIKEGDEHFEAIRGGSADLIGIVLNLEIEVAEKHRLKEEVKVFKHVDNILPDLDKMMHENQYFTLSYIPTYRHIPVADEGPGQTVDIPNWNVRLWNVTTESKTRAKDTSPVEMILEDIAHDVLIDAKGEMQDLLFRKELHHLIPAYMKLVAALAYVKRGEDTVVASANNIHQYKKAQSDDVIRTTFHLPVADDASAAALGNALRFMDDTLTTMAREGDSGFGTSTAPITYCINVRYLKGTNGGLSTTHTKDNERILAVELVTHKEAHGFSAFRQKLIDYFDSQNLSFRFAYSQDVPAGVNGYQDYMGGDQAGLDAFKAGLLNAYGSQDGIGTSPYLSPFYHSMLKSVDERGSDEIEIEPTQEKQPEEHSKTEVTRYLRALLLTFNPIVKFYLQDKGQEVQFAWSIFKDAVNAAILQVEIHAEKGSVPEIERQSSSAQLSPMV